MRGEVLEEFHRWLQKMVNRLYLNIVKLLYLLHRLQKFLCHTGKELKVGQFN